jgi:hypothetical protein
MRRGADILRGPTGWFAERGRSMERPIGIAQQFAAEQNQIGVAPGPVNS